MWIIPQLLEYHTHTHTTPYHIPHTYTHQNHHLQPATGLAILVTHIPTDHNPALILSRNYVFLNHARKIFINEEINVEKINYEHVIIYKVCNF